MAPVSILLITLSIFVVIKCQDCPAIYRRFSKTHTFCLPPNPMCHIIIKGVPLNDKEIILATHNKYRSQVATGWVDEGTIHKYVPPAANMLEVTWDDELAAIAQKWAEQCQRKKDCEDCRATRSYPTGQNVVAVQQSCTEHICHHKKSRWATVIKNFFFEVNAFHNETVDAMDAERGKTVGHISQMVWASTFKIGCGFVSFDEGNFGKQVYVCNYGPTGNIMGSPFYIKGPTCSNCPINSCCGHLCPKVGNIYPGLCKLLSFPPIYPPETNALFFCDFQPEDSSCSYTIESGKWELVNTNGGTYLSVIANTGEKAIVQFNRVIQVPAGWACMILTMRRGPQVAGEVDSSSTELLLTMNGETDPPLRVLDLYWSDFIQSPVEINFEGGNLQFKIHFSVPFNAPPQFLEVKKIGVYAGKCPANR